MAITLKRRIKREADERWRLHEGEHRLAARYGAIDAWANGVTVVIATATAVTIWPESIAAWISGALALVTALVASIRTVYDPARRRTDVAKRSTALKWSAKRLYRLGDDLDQGVINEADAQSKFGQLMDDAKEEIDLAEEEVSLPEPRPRRRPAKGRRATVA